MSLTIILASGDKFSFDTVKKESGKNEVIFQIETTRKNLAIIWLNDETHVSVHFD